MKESLNQSCLSRTYEELKHTIFDYFLFVFSCLSRTYEELKLVRGMPYARPGMYVYRVPMRNWNTFFLNLICILLPSLSRTYEELKHIFSFTKMLGISSLSRTYEELKLNRTNHVFFKLFSLSRTYEELKHLFLSRNMI